VFLELVLPLEPQPPLLQRRSLVHAAREASEAPAGGRTEETEAVEGSTAPEARPLGQAEVSPPRRPASNDARSMPLLTNAVGAFANTHSRLPPVASA